MVVRWYCRVDGVMVVRWYCKVDGVMVGWTNIDTIINITKLN